jgi:hypothetical protein
MFFCSGLSISTITTYAVSYLDHTSHVTRTSVEVRSALECTAMNAAVHASGSRSADIHVQLSAPSGLLWEGEVPGDGSFVLRFVLREAVVALQQHPGVLTLLIDTMVLSPSNSLRLFLPGHSYDVMVFVDESPKLLRTWFAKWRQHTDFMPALVAPHVWIMPALVDPLEDIVPAPEGTDSDSIDDEDVALREHQVRGVSHCPDHVYVSLHVRVAHPSSGVMPIVIQLMSQTMVARLES